MSTGGLPWLGSPACEWTPKGATRPCGEPATWQATTHDFTHESGTDPDGTRLWLLCAGCALALLRWVKRRESQGTGFYCRGCATLIRKPLGGFLAAYGELGRPEMDIEN